MGPDWKAFVEELIQYFGSDPYASMMRENIVTIIKEREIKFLEKSLKIMDEEEGVEI